jgi:hypothetical protein
VRVPLVPALQFVGDPVARIVDQPDQPPDLQLLRARQAVMTVVYTKDTNRWSLLRIFCFRKQDQPPLYGQPAVSGQPHLARPGGASTRGPSRAQMVASGSWGSYRFVPLLLLSCGHAVY